MHRRYAFIYFFLAASIHAQPCEIQMADLTEKLEITNQVPVLRIFDLIDADSNEPVNRYVQLLPDGAIIIVEQKHCLIYNLSITLLLPESELINESPQRLATILHETPVWQKWFETLDVKKILSKELVSEDFVSHINKSKSFIYNLNDKFIVKNETNEAYLRVNFLDSSELPFEIILSLHISVGGL